MGFLSQLTRYDSTRIQPYIALRNTLGLTVPLIAGVSAGKPEYAVLGALGAMNTAFSDGSDPYVPRARRMLAAAALSALAIVAGAMSGWHPMSAGVLIAGWSLGAGLLVALDAAAADIGLLSLVMVLVFAGQPMQPDGALTAGFIALLGGCLQTAFSVAFWPFRRYEPERRVIVALYTELSATAASPIRTSQAPPASSHANEAQAVIRALGRTHTVQGDRYVSLVSQAERIRLSILRLRNASYLHEVSLILDAIARTLSGQPASLDPQWLSAVSSDALAGQLRAAWELATSSTPAGREAFERRQMDRPWRLRAESTIGTLAANMSLRSPAMRHAIRLSAAVIAGESFAHATGGERAYWLPMTAAIVLKPDFGATFSRGLLRILGTLAGLSAATLLFYLATPTVALEVAIIPPIVFILRCFGGANYGIFTAALTAYIVVLFALAGQAPQEVIRERAWNTLLGGALALVMYAVWPTWERTQIGETLARMLDAYRTYLRAVHEHSPDLDRNRPEGRLTRSNAEAALDRFAAEPGADPADVTLLSQIMASSHRVIHAMMAIEAGLTTTTPEFSSFAHKVEIVLHSLAGALRGSRFSPEALPDLRMAHNRMVEAGHELVAETDRLTNSVNTLTELVLRFTRNEARPSGPDQKPEPPESIRSTRP